MLKTVFVTSVLCFFSVFASEQNVLLLILDGLDINSVPENLKILSQDGVHADLLPQYPTELYPNLYSMMTGKSSQKIQTDMTFNL